MRLLLDENLSFRLVAMLESHGHDVVHVDDLDLVPRFDEAVEGKVANVDTSAIDTTQAPFDRQAASPRRTSPRP